MSHQYKSKRVTWGPLLSVVSLVLVFISSNPNLVQAEVNADDYFSMNLTELMNVEITTAAKQEQKVSDIPASVVIITRNEIALKGYRNLTDILKNIPGFYVIETDSYYGDPVGVRGYWTDTGRNIKFLINGDDMVGDWNNNYRSIGRNVPVSAIERIELVRGPMSVIYGSGAFLGVINIITKSQSESELYSEVKVVTGSRNTKSASIRLVGNTVFGHESKPIRLTVNLTNETSDGREYDYADIVTSISSIARMVPLLEHPENLTTKGLLKYDRVYFDTSLNVGKFTVNLMYGGDREGEIFNITFEPGSIEEGAKTVASVTYKDQFSDDFSYSIKAGASKLVANWNTHSWYEGLEFIEVMNTNAKFIDIDGFYDLQKTTTLIFGFSYRQVDLFRYDWDYTSIGFNESMELKDGDKKETSSIYTQLSHSFSENMDVVAGFRVENESDYTVVKMRNVNFDLLETLLGTGDVFGPETVELNGNHDSSYSFIPRLGLIYKFKDYTLKLLYAESIYRPGLFQYSEAKGVQLEPEEMRTLELVGQGSFTDNSNYSASLFANKVTNLAIRETELVDPDVPSSWTSQTVSIGAVDTVGVEFILGAKFFNALKVDASVTLQDSENSRDGFEDIDLEYSPKVLAYLNFLYSVDDSLSVNFGGRYMSEVESLWVGPQDSGSRIGETTAGYFVWNFSANWDQAFDDNTLNLSLTIDNVFDKDYRLPTASFLVYANAGLPGEERTVQASATVTF